MSDFAKRLGVMREMREMRKNHLVQLRNNCTAPEKDANGSASNSLAGTLRFLAVVDYVLDKEVLTFRSGLAETVELRKKLLQRFDTGEAISPSYVSMMTYKTLLNALASGDEGLSKSFASQMGGREEVELEYDRKFDVAFGYTLKNILLADDLGAARHLELFDLSCQDPENMDFKGCSTIMHAILNHDIGEAMIGVNQLIAGHKRQSKASGLFKDTEDEVLCVWGLGLANLARLRGLHLESNDPLIPNALLI